MSVSFGTEAFLLVRDRRANELCKHFGEDTQIDADTFADKFKCLENNYF